MALMSKLDGINRHSFNAFRLRVGEPRPSSPTSWEGSWGPAFPSPAVGQLLSLHTTDMITFEMTHPYGQWRPQSAAVTSAENQVPGRVVTEPQAVRRGAAGEEVGRC